jgi:predicted acylesterase/phospholipase RssA
MRTDVWGTIYSKIPFRTIDAGPVAKSHKVGRYDAIGLALSGGGIRSATLCLGVVQVLVACGLMKDADYLSTISGGGYTGSFITSAGGIR